jgi:hypothetical protein
MSCAVPATDRPDEVSGAAPFIPLCLLRLRGDNASERAKRDFAHDPPTRRDTCIALEIVKYNIFI